MHWYNKDGQLFDTDLKTARKEGYGPSVTEIIHEFDNNYGLQMYYQKQMFLASMTLPRPEGITDEQFYDLVLEDSKVHSEKAKQFGIDIHKCATEMLKNIPYSKIWNDEIYYRAMKVVDWIRENKDSVIVDFKTQETKDGKFRHYDSWLHQLCGYYLKGYFMERGEYIDYPFYNWITNGAYGGTIDFMIKQENHYDKFKLINIIISSNEDIPIKVYEWPEKKVLWGLEVFPKMVDLYHTIKKLEVK